MKVKTIFKTIQEYIFITFGLLLYTLGWTAFIMPAKLNSGGVSGISVLISYATDIPAAIPLFVINILLLLIAFRILGASFGIRTIYAIVVQSLLFYIFQKYITQPIVHEVFMASLIGAILAGVGIGITFSYKGSTGGLDIIVLIINKYRNISPGRIILLLDSIIIASSYLIFESLEKLVYGFVMMAVTAYAVDVFLEGSQQSLQVIVISKNNTEIAQKIATEIDRGITVFQATGWYSKKDVHPLMIILRKYELNQIMRIIKEIDPVAFLSVGKVMGVYGKGFDAIK
ncbi:MAG: YitT family protein [Spirochaetes bacterium]|nr:YitT family protein [Spirochaetota bacterium]